MATVPAPWHDADIGTVGRAGSSADDNGAVRVSGGGADIWGEADAFHYVYAPLSGNGGIIAQVTAVKATNGWAKAGVMVRETAAPDSRFVLLAFTPSHGVTLQVRSATHVTPTSATYAGAPGVYLRLARAGSVITASDSANEQTWHTLASVTLPLPNNVQVGLAVTAHDNAQLNTSTFAHVAIQTSMTPASPWSVGTSDYLARWESDTATVGGTVYVFGGYVNRALQATTETDAYTPATNTWAHVDAEPLPVTHAGTCAVGTTIYLAGGYLGQQTASAPMTAAVQAYDTVHNSWFSLPPLPAPVAAGGLVCVGRTLYFFGGINPGRQTDSARTWALDLDDPAAGWAARANMPDARNHIGYATLNGLVYAIGGLHLTDEIHDQDAQVDVYNPATNTWARGTSLPFAWSHFNDATLVANGKIVIVGGQANGGDDGIYLPNVEEYNPTTRAWTALPPLPDARQAAAGAFLNGTLVVIDGAVEADGGGWPQQQVWLYPSFRG